MGDVPLFLFIVSTVNSCFFSAAELQTTQALLYSLNPVPLGRSSCTCAINVRFQRQGQVPAQGSICSKNMSQCTAAQ